MENEEMERDMDDLREKIYMEKKIGENEKEDWMEKVLIIEKKNMEVEKKGK
jgi:hypothetical protein